MSQVVESSSKPKVPYWWRRLHEDCGGEWEFMPNDENSLVVGCTCLVDED